MKTAPENWLLIKVLLYFQQRSESIEIFHVYYNGILH